MRKQKTLCRLQLGLGSLMSNLLPGEGRERRFDVNERPNKLEHETRFRGLTQNLNDSGFARQSLFESQAKMNLEAHKMEK